MYDVRSHSYADTQTGPGTRISEISLGADFYLKQKNGPWLELIRSPKLYHPAIVGLPGPAFLPYIKDATAVRRTGPDRYVATENFDEFMAAGADQIPAIASILKSGHASGTVTITLALTPKGLPLHMVDRQIISTGSATLMEVTTRAYSRYNQSVELAAPPSAEISRRIHINSLAELEALIG